MNMTGKIVTLGSVSLAAALTFSLIHTAPALGQPPAGAKGGAPKGGIAKGPDSRVQQRTYHFTDTNEEMPYALFVSSKVRKNTKAPLIVALHGVFGDGNSLLRGATLDMAEEGGYILVGPMGYNPQGWYGSPVIVMGGGPGAGKGKGAGPGAPGAVKGPGPGGAKGKGGPQPTPDPPNLAELSEKDVMNVLELMRKEFTVDPQRTYLMGHSMGGAGALFLGIKHVSQWAAVASMAPAAFLMDPATLAPVKDTMPLYLAHGDADTVVPTDVGRRWAKSATDLKMKDFHYFEIPGADHGTVITEAMPEIFKFFRAHTR